MDRHKPSRINIEVWIAPQRADGTPQEPAWTRELLRSPVVAAIITAVAAFAAALIYAVAT